MSAYNPDGMYFVVETKGSPGDSQLRGMEKAKTQCAKKHFAAISPKVKYVAASNYDNLLDQIKDYRLPSEKAAPGN